MRFQEQIQYQRKFKKINFNNNINNLNKKVQTTNYFEHNMRNFTQKLSRHLVIFHKKLDNSVKKKKTKNFRKFRGNVMKSLGKCEKILSEKNK